MVRFVVDLQECGGVINWKQVAGIVDEKPEKKPVAKGPAGDDDGSGGEDMDEEMEAGGAEGRPAGIFDKIIAKWGGHGPEGGDEDEEFEDGGGEIDASDDDYDMEDDMIDNSELEHRFETKARAHRARKRPNQLGGFYVVNESKNQMDESDEDEDEDEDEDDEEDDEEDDDEGGGGGGGEGGRKRRRRRKWIAEGENDFKQVPAIMEKIEQLRKEAEAYFTEGADRKFLPKELLQYVVDAVEIIEQQKCALAPFFEHLEGFLKFKAKTLQMRARNAMLAGRGKRIEDATIKELANLVQSANNAGASLPDGSDRDPSSLAFLLKQILAGTVQRSTVKALRKELVATCSKLTKLLRNFHDSARQESMIVLLHQQATALFEENNTGGAASLQQLKEELAKAAKSKKATVPLDAFTQGLAGADAGDAGMGAAGGQVLRGGLRKGNIFDPIPANDKQPKP